MSNHRAEARIRHDLPGYFHVDGRLVEIKLHDHAESGLGIYTSHQFREGQQGIVLLKNPSSGAVREVPGEIRWCQPDPGVTDHRFPYRAGLRLIA
jgi:hypothetical protein